MVAIYSICRAFNLEVKESEIELESLPKQERDVRKRERLQFLYWYKTGQATTRKALESLLHWSQVAIGHGVMLLHSGEIKNRPRYAREQRVKG